MASSMSRRMLAWYSYAQRLFRPQKILSSIPQHQLSRRISGSPSKAATVVGLVPGCGAPALLTGSLMNIASGAPPSLPMSYKEADYYKNSDYFWQKISKFEAIPPEEFITATFSSRNDIKLTKVSVKGADARWSGSLEAELRAILPAEVPAYGYNGLPVPKEEVIQSVLDDAKKASMSVRVTPYIWSRINFADPLNDPLFKQYVSAYSARLADHPALKLDSLNEKADSPVKGLVWRYPTKVLQLLTDSCPLYCQYCTRSYAVSNATDAVESKDSIKPAWPRISKTLDYIRDHPVIRDVVVSGGDVSMVDAMTFAKVCDALINMKSIRYFRIASRVLAVSPGRLLDPDDEWTNVLLSAAHEARRNGKSMFLHTHFQHPNEISEMTREAAHRLHLAGVTMRNQTVMIKGINDTVKIQSQLIQELSWMQVQPYYVYQCDMVPGIEHFRTTLEHFNAVANIVQGTNAGFMLPKYIVDLPGGGGKRGSHTYESYDTKTGLTTWKSAAIDKGEKKDKIYKYWDPKRYEIPKHALELPDLNAAGKFWDVAAPPTSPPVYASIGA